jgi:regulatory protein
MRLLTRRDHSEAEIVRKLAGANFEPRVVSLVITRLKELGVINDLRFARIWAESAIRNRRSFGPKLKAELSAKGISPEIIGQTLQQLAETVNENDAAVVLLRRKFPEFTPDGAPLNLKRRVYNFLLRRGISPMAATAAMKLREGAVDSLD